MCVVVGFIMFTRLALLCLWDCGSLCCFVDAGTEYDGDAYIGKS